jgi:hypothetical protein
VDLGKDPFPSVLGMISNLRNLNLIDKKPKDHQEALDNKKEVAVAEVADQALNRINQIIQIIEEEKIIPITQIKKHKPEIKMIFL